MGTSLEIYKQRLAKKSEVYASEEETSESFFSLRGGILTLGEEELPGNEMLVVVLDAVHENTYFPGAWDPEATLPPKCFAFGRSEKEMQPHDNVPDLDSEEAEDSYFEMQVDYDPEKEDPFCDQCPHSEWGSADKGRGKKCANRRRLAVIPAGRFLPGKTRRDAAEMAVFEDPQHYREASIAFLKLPVTSTKNWSRYVRKLNKDHQVPPFAVLTHIWLENDEKTSFKVCFDTIEVIEDEDLLEILFKRNEEAEGVIEQPYSEPTAEDLEKPKAKTKTGLSGLRKSKDKRKRD